MNLTRGQIFSEPTKVGYILTVKCWGGADHHRVLEWIKQSNSKLIYSDQKELTIKCEILREAIPIFEKVVGVPLGLK